MKKLSLDYIPDDEWSLKFSHSRLKFWSDYKGNTHNKKAFIVAHLVNFTRQKHQL